MRELAELRMTAENKAGYDGNYYSIKERINTVYNLGYIYDPYKDKFWNPFFDTYFLSNDIYDYESDKLVSLHAEKLFSTGKLARNMTEIRQVIKNKQNGLLGMLFKLGPILGVIFMVSSIITYFHSSIYVSLTLSVVSMLSLNTYSTKYSAKSEFEQTTLGLPMFWRRFSILIVILAFLNYGLFYWIFSELFDSWWKSLFFAPIIYYIIPNLATNHLSKEYWKNRGIFSIKEFAKENNVL